MSKSKITNIDIHVGKRTREERIARGLSQTVVADALDLSRGGPGCILVGGMAQAGKSLVAAGLVARGPVAALEASGAFGVVGTHRGSSTSS